MTGRTGRKPLPWRPGRCESCRKVLYNERSEAKRVRRMTGDHGLSVYACPSGLGFHLGHVAAAVKAGLLTRDDVYGDAS